MTVEKKLNKAFIDSLIDVENKILDEIVSLKLSKVRYL